MARNKRKTQNSIVKQRRLDRYELNSIIRSEPVIRITDRRRDYGDRRRAELARITKGFAKHIQITNAPKRTVRKTKLRIASALFPQVYKKEHSCSTEWRKTLSWRSAQGAGRKRTSREMQNNKRSFKQKDC